MLALLVLRVISKLVFYTVDGKFITGIITRSSNNLVDSATGEFSSNYIYHIDQAPVPVHFYMNMISSSGAIDLSSTLVTINQSMSNKNNQPQLALPYQIDSALPKWEDIRDQKNLSKVELESLMEKYLQKSIQDLEKTKLGPGGSQDEYDRCEIKQSPIHTMTKTGSVLAGLRSKF